MKYVLSPDDIIRCRQISHANRDLVKSIAHAVCEKSGTQVSEVFSTNRARHVVATRHLVMYLAHKAGLSYPEIGKAINRDHTTVMEGVKAEQKRRGISE
jgi:chromosomal replication initiation ATPase DnaA